MQQFHWTTTLRLRAPKKVEAGWRKEVELSLALEAQAHIEVGPVLLALEARVARVLVRKFQQARRKVQADRKSDFHSEITTIQYRGKLHMAMQKTPHTQSEQNRGPERSDLEPDEQQFESDSETEERLYSEMKGAETGTDRSPKKAPSRGPHHNTEPETVAHEGSVSTRTPKRPAQGVTSHSAEEESARQQKVVNDRPDAQAGVKHSK